jgi:hypothetical protein
MLFTVVDKNLGNIEEIDAVSERQAIYKLALEKTKNMNDKKSRKRATGTIFEAMLKSHQALLLNDPNQMDLFQ